jgi:hypothetical protein
LVQPQPQTFLTKIKEFFKDLKSVIVYDVQLISSLFFDLREFIIRFSRYVFKTFNANIIEIFKKPENKNERKPKKFFFLIFLTIYVILLHLLVLDLIYKGLATLYVIDSIFEMLYLSQKSVLLFL